MAPFSRLHVTNALISGLSCTCLGCPWGRICHLFDVK